MSRNAEQRRARVSSKSARFTESVIREMTRLAIRYGAINLAQGFPNFPAPEEIKQAACRAIADDCNQYSITWGAPALRQAIAERYSALYGAPVDPETEITVCCGATEAMIATLLAVVDPGDEVIIFEPFYENYGPDAILCGAHPRYVRLRPPDWSFDPEELAAAFGPAVRAIIVNTPHNPTGKVFTPDELRYIGELCERWGALLITDEIYEAIVYDGRTHRSPAALPELRPRTVVVNGVSKTYSVTGWRIGWCIAPPDMTAAIRKVHDFLTVGAPAPLQEAAAVALRLPAAYYQRLAADYQQRRDVLVAHLQRAGFQCWVPQGAYYIMTDISSFGFTDDVSFARYLVEHVGVAAVPGSSFYAQPAEGQQRIRFAFCKTLDLLEEAGRRLARLRQMLGNTPAASAPPGGDRSD
jgi:aspartate/methionine/tyrosine aminotransferase